METILETWRQTHADQLRGLYWIMQEALAEPDRSFTTQDIATMTGMLGTTTQQTELSESGKTLILDLADGKIDLGSSSLGHVHQTGQIADWIEQIEKPSKWGRMREVDTHIIHMHMAALHGERLPEMIRQAGITGLIPWYADAIETDTLSLHLISTRCAEVDDDLGLPEDATEPERIETIRQTIDRIAEARLNWTRLPSTERRGISITAKHNDARVRIEGDHATLTFENLPETLKNASSYVGRPLHDIVDVCGFRDDAVRIHTMDLKGNGTVILQIDRDAPAARRRIERDSFG